MPLSVVLVQINPANTLMVEAALRGIDDDDVVQTPDRITWRQLLPPPIVNFGDFPARQNVVVTFTGDPPADGIYRLNAFIWDADNNPYLGPSVDYNPTERPRLSASGLARSGGSARLAGRLLQASASGLAPSGGSASLGQPLRHRVSASGRSASGGSATLELEQTWHRVTAHGAARSGGSADLELRGPVLLSASGLARSGGSAALLHGVTVTAGASGAASSGGRIRLRVRSPISRFGRIARAFPLQATIEHRGPADVFRDEYGDVPIVTTSIEEVAANLQPQWSREQTENQNLEATSFNLYLPAGVELGPQDRVVIDGVSYEVFGPGRGFNDFDGAAHHTEAVLRRVA